MEDQIAKVVEQYFQELFTSANPTNMGSVLNSMDRLITLDMNNSLVWRYTSNEDRRALLQMHPSKSPSLDGMSHFIFQKFWNIFSLDVIEAILSALNSKHMLHKMNYTHIVLIPKKNDPK